MILAIYLENMAVDSVTGKFYDNLGAFALDRFDIKISDDGVITTDGNVSTISYRLDVKNFTKEGAIKDYINSATFRDYAKTRFWSFYKVEKLYGT
jgi:hypothetical protein